MAYTVPARRRNQQNHRDEGKQDQFVVLLELLENQYKDTFGFDINLEYARDTQQHFPTALRPRYPRVDDEGFRVEFDRQVRAVVVAHTSDVDPGRSFGGFESIPSQHRIPLSMWSALVNEARTSYLRHEGPVGATESEHVKLRDLILFKTSGIGWMQARQFHTKAYVPAARYIEAYNAAMRPPWYQLSPEAVARFQSERESGFQKLREPSILALLGNQDVVPDIQLPNHAWFQLADKYQQSLNSRLEPAFQSLFEVMGSKRESVLLIRRVGAEKTHLHLSAREKYAIMRAFHDLAVDEQTPWYRLFYYDVAEKKKAHNDDIRNNNKNGHYNVVAVPVIKNGASLQQSGI